jgi:phosphoglycolate phosphatase-like HAD superfamily hydrolase
LTGSDPKQIRCAPWRTGTGWNQRETLPLAQDNGDGNEMRLGHAAPAMIFDVEGTLVDCVQHTLESWQETLADFGVSAQIGQLHKYSGMDGGEMLDRLLQDGGAQDLKHEILTEQGIRYRDKFLPTVRPFPGVRAMFEGVRDGGWRIALATTCQPDELEHYGSILGAFDLVDVVACGADTKRGKPHPELFVVALQRLGIEGRQAVALGDTPYDAIAAVDAGIDAIAGTLTGGFSRTALQDAGCRWIVESATEMLPIVRHRHVVHTG